jgi:undecaprenyl-diphosphatase
VSTGVLRPIRPSLQPVALFAAFLVVVVVAWGLGELISGPLDSTIGAMDRSLVTSVAEWRSPALTTFMRAATFFGSSVWLVGSLTAVVVVVVLQTRSPRWAAFAVGCMIGGFISTIVKRLVDRPRPDIDPLVDLESAAFPSGHALSSAIAFLAIAYVLIHLTRLPRRLVWTGAILCTGIVGFTRVYLGVHWPTDVIGGWLAGAVWVAVVAFVVRPGRN